MAKEEDIKENKQVITDIDHNRNLLKSLKQKFPETQSGRQFMNSLNVHLEENFDFTPESTIFTDGLCSDEINEYELLM